MAVIIIGIHITVCLLLIIVVLLQAGKGAGMGSAFTGSNQSFMDSSGANTFLSRATTFAAIVFMLTSLSMGYMHGRESTSIMDNKNDFVILDDNLMNDIVLKEETPESVICEE